MEALFACILLVVTFWLIYYLGTRNHGYWKDRGVPYAQPLPFVGNLLDLLLLRRNQGQIVKEIYNKFLTEPLVGMWNFGQPVLLVRDPSLVNQVLVSDFSNFHHNEIDVDETVDPVMSQNLFCSRGAAWKRRRQILTPAFTVGKVKSSFDKLTKSCDQLIHFIEKHPGDFQAKDLMARFMCDVVSSWGLGIDSHSFAEDSILLRCGKSIFDPTLANGLKNTVNFLFPFLSRLFKVPFFPAEVPKFFETVISDMLAHRKKTGECEPDYLQHFIDTQQKLQSRNDEFEIKDDDILSGVVTFFAESYETSSMVSSFLLYSLAMNPKIQQQLRTEVSRPERLTYDDVNDMVLLEQCFKETNRLYPGIGNMSKVCTTTTTLGGVKVEAGTTVLIPLMGLHMDPSIWDAPEEFRPQRFQEDIQRKGVYVPFGDGPRVCIGLKMAGTVVKTVVARIVRDFNIVPSARTPKKYVQNPLHFMPSQKGGMYLKFEKLNK